MALEMSDIAGGGKAFQFDEIGDKCVGEIKLIERRQQRSFDGGAPLTWDDGSPRLLTYIEIQTDLQEDGEDDGVRALYCKGGANFEAAEGKGTSAEVALVNAMKDAGTKTMDEGGTLAMVFTGRAKPTTRGYQPAKLFQAQYKPPTHSVAADDLFAQ